MYDLIRGLKSGLAAGIIYISALTLFTLIAIYIIVQCSPTVGSPNLLTPHIKMIFGVTGFPAIILGTLIGTLAYVIIGGIGGIIFGLIFATVYNSLPGSTSIFKGITLSYIFWLIFSVFLGFIFGAINISYYIVIYILIGFISSIIYGYSLGKFWDKFGKKRLVIK